ncbi:hypothetical protein DFS33DRAFT_1274379 [Desarmillaria ectypa]|nr:hypothetical protein DFS33DRAFT_1274379 [Desarmillaria ectypa]
MQAVKRLTMFDLFTLPRQDPTNLSYSFCRLPTVSKLRRTDGSGYVDAARESFPSLSTLNSNSERVIYLLLTIRHDRPLMVVKMCSIIQSNGLLVVKRLNRKPSPQHPHIARLRRRCKPLDYALIVTLVLVVRKAVSLVLSVAMRQMANSVDMRILWASVTMVLLGTIWYSLGGKKAKDKKD